MNRPFSTLAVLLLAIAPLSAQMVASHPGALAATPAPAAAAPNVQLQQPNGKPVVKVNGTVLTDRDLLREMLTIFPYARQHNGYVPRAMEADIRRGALQMIEFEELVYQDAVRRGVTISPARMQKAEAQFRKQFHSPDDYKAFMQEECQGSTKVMREKIRRSLLIDKAMNQLVNTPSAVSLAEARAYFTRHPEQFRIPESYSIQTISVLPPQNANAAQLKEAKKRAEEAYKKARTTKNYEEFGMLAEQISEDDWRVMMGDRREVDVTKLPPMVLQWLKKMKPGEVSDLIQVEQSYTIVRLNAHVPEGQKKFADVKADLIKQLQKQKVEKLRSQLNARLRQTAKVEEL